MQQIYLQLRHPQLDLENLRSVNWPVLASACEMIQAEYAICSFISFKIKGTVITGFSNTATRRKLGRDIDSPNVFCKLILNAI